MDKLIKGIDPNLEYEWSEEKGDVMRVYAVSARSKAQCPYCGSYSGQVHSVYQRKFRDLPIQGKKVEVIIKNRKFFCRNPECEHKTFAERYECLPRKARNSRRLTQAIVNTSIHMSSIAASKTLKQGTVDVGKSTICRLLKKRARKLNGRLIERNQKWCV